jgi:hypothetical protein
MRQEGKRAAAPPNAEPRWPEGYMRVLREASRPPPSAGDPRARTDPHSGRSYGELTEGVKAKPRPAVAPGACQLRRGSFERRGANHRPSGWPLPVVPARTQSIDRNGSSGFTTELATELDAAWFTTKFSGYVGLRGLSGLPLHRRQLSNSQKQQFLRMAASSTWTNGIVLPPPASPTHWIQPSAA